MAQQLQRDYLLKVGPPGGTGREFRPPGQISFEVEQGVTRSIDKLKIQLINLGPEDTEFLLQRNLRVILEAGYLTDRRGVIFAGQVAQKGVRATSVVTRRETTEYIVDIEAGSGEIALQGGRFDRSYARDVTNIQIIDDIAASLGVKVLGRDAIRRQTYRTGWTHSGTVTEALQELGDSINTQWAVQGDSLLMLETARSLSERVSIISPSTGLIGDAVRSVDGVEWTNYLNYRLRPGRRVKLRAPGVRNGIYKINRLKHTGNFREGPWFSECFSRYTGG